MMQHLTYVQQIILELLRLSIGGSQQPVSKLTEKLDWLAISEFSRKHVILPIILNEAMLLPDEMRPPQEIITQWKAYVISTVLHNERSMSAQTQIISMLHDAGIPCAVLKGTSVAALYPRPELRTLGDIDLLVRENQCTAAVQLLETQGYRKHESDHAFHIGFDKAGTYLELHYAVTEFPDSAMGKRLRENFRCAVNRSKCHTIEHSTFPVLAEFDQALSLLLHMERHMIEGGIGLRQLCDWFVFVDSLGYECLEKYIIPAIQQYGLYQFAGCLTNICVRYLGLDAEKNKWCMGISSKTVDALLVDILDNGNIAKGELERASSSTFVKGEESTDVNQSLLKTVTRNLTESAKKQFPICNRLQFLLPILWFYIPIRYLYRSMKGTRPKQSVRKVASYAVKRKRLYRKLELFKK